jgi:DNA-binding SARP family transcriptional activator
MFAREGMVREPVESGSVQPPPGALAWPILICLLGPFRVLQAGRTVPVRGEKTVALLCHLALRYTDGVQRDSLLDILWPGRDPALAVEALHSRVHSLHRLLGAGIGGAAPVVYADGWYRLNGAAGVAVDAPCFDALASAGDRLARAGDPAASAAAHLRAVQLYQGDLWIEADDLQAIVERERLRTRYLGLLARLADHAYGEDDYAACLRHAQRLLRHAPCREDAHRAIMRCHVRLGERA